MRKKLIDFGAYRTPKFLAAVIHHFDLRGSKGDTLRNRGPCPICTPTDTEKRCLAVDLRQGVWFCHRCKCSGSALTLYMLVTGVPVYEAAEDLSRLVNEPIPYLDDSPPDLRPERASIPRQGTGRANRNNNLTYPVASINGKMPGGAAG